MDQEKTYSQVFLENNFLLGNVQGGIVYSDACPPFHLRYATGGMTQLAGYTVDELCAMQQMDIVHFEDQASLAEDIRTQLSVGDTFSVEYRLKRKDGSYVYVLDRAKVVPHENGEKYLHCLLTDISDLKALEQALRLNEEKYKLAIQQSGNVIIEYSLVTGAIQFSENYTQIFQDAPSCTTMDEVLRSEWIDESCKGTLQAHLAQVIRTRKTCAVELLFHTSKGPLWCNLHLIPVIDKGNFFSIIGCLENINDAKKKMERLTQLSLRDSLTGAFNRYAIERFVKDRVSCLTRTDAAALMVLDIDFFKQINDTHGHEYGDKILIHLSALVASVLPENAVFGRLGGDEFLIFATFPKDSANLAELANTIVHTVAVDETPVGISLGAAWHRPDCASFQEMYRNADAALYMSKRKQRGTYHIYGE